MSQISWFHAAKLAIEREGVVAKRNEAEDQIANLDDFFLLSPRDGERGREHQLFPAQAAVNKEHCGAHHIEQAPATVLEEVEFQLVDISHRDRLHRRIVSPE